MNKKKLIIIIKKKSIKSERQGRKLRSLKISRDVLRSHLFYHCLELRNQNNKWLNHYYTEGGEKEKGERSSKDWTGFKDRGLDP